MIFTALRHAEFPTSLLHELTFRAGPL